MIFEVTPAHIEALSDADLRTLIGYLAEQEITRAGYSASCVTYGGHQNAADGGIDVRSNVGGGNIAGYIPRPQTGFQVKAEDMAAADIGREMCPGGALRASITALREAGGAYIIVSSTGSVSDTALSKRRNAMARAVADTPAAAGLHLDFYDRRRVASWVNQHPGLIPWVRSRVGLPLSGWRPFEDWSSSPGAADEAYLTDDHVRLVSTRLKDTNGLSAIDGINKVREILSQPKGSVRLVGLSGVGKTRLVQALFDETLGADALDKRLAVYTDLADGPDPVPQELQAHIHNLDQRCILIIDNCGIDLHRKLVARMKNAKSGVSLITIEYDISDNEPENTDTFKLEPSSSEIIEKIIARRYPQLTNSEIRTIANFSEGNSRVALALAETAQDGESLANLQDSDLIERLFRQNRQDNPALLRAAKVCSLVYSFDGETLEGDEAELPLLAALAEQTVSEFHGHVAELHRRQLVQKRSKWRALLPHALAHKLAKQALQDIPAQTLSQKLSDIAPERLLKSFSRRLGCLHESPEAQAIVGQWLGSGGRLENVESLSDLDIVLLDNVAPVNPDAVMTAIRSAAKRSADFFSDSNPHRRETVDLLRSLAYDAQTFDEAVGCIAKLARVVTESNNTGEAINVFKSMFYIYLSGTHAPPQQRAGFLMKLARGDNEAHAMVLSALDAMLECSHFSSGYGFEFGTRKRDYGYHPNTRAEINDWYKTTFAFAQNLAQLPAYRDEVRKMVASQLRHLAPDTGLTDELVALSDSFASDGGWPEGWAGARAAARAAKKAKRKDDAGKFEALAKRLEPNSIHQRISSYVLPEQWGALDIAEIDFEDSKRFEKAHKQVELVCAGIGKELAADLRALADHLPMMLQSSSMRVSTVAAEVGRATTAPQDAWNIIKTAVTTPDVESKGFAFPAHFLLGLAEQNKVLADAYLDEALASPAFHPSFVYMQSVVGVDARGCDRIVEASKLESVPTHTFGTLGYGRACDDLDGASFKRVVLAFAPREGGVAVALDVLRMRLLLSEDKKKPLDPDVRALGRELVAMSSFEKRRQNDGRTLAVIARACLVSPADDALAEKLCAKLLDAIGRWKVSPYDYSELVTELGGLFPHAVLNVLVERGTEVTEGRRGMFTSFREHRPCPLRKISDDVLLDWARERPETRFHQLAQVIRPWRSADKNVQEGPVDEETGPLRWTNAALRVLHEAPEPEAVLSEFIERFRPSGWSGSLAGILASRLPLIERLTSDPNSVIAEAAKKAVVTFNEQIERTREREAREDRQRDERFEW